jgi:hypothetical protein
VCFQGTDCFRHLNFRDGVLREECEATGKFLVQTDPTTFREFQCIPMPDKQKDSGARK